MANTERQMPAHVEGTYKDAVDNVIFLKRQQWVATNYAILVYAAIFVISSQYFSRTDFARNSLGMIDYTYPWPKSVTFDHTAQHSLRGPSVHPPYAGCCFGL